jgi:hypothetical protein
MTALTKVLPRLAPDPVPPTLSGTWEADLDRCAVEVRVGERVGLWRARLRMINLRVLLPDVDATDQSASITAVLGVDPVLASVPATRGLFLPSTPRADHITVSASGPVLPAGQGVTMRAHAAISTEDRAWMAVFAVHIEEFDDLHLGLSLSGSVPRSVPGPFRETRIHVDAAAELIRCG